MDADVPRWFKSSHSAPETCCVEAATAGPEADVRDSAHPDGPVLRVGAAEWSVFLRAVPERP